MLQTNRVLQKEQTQLFAIQKKLENALPLVQEALNSLKVVEELHLKSLGLQNGLEPQGPQGPQATPVKGPFLHVDFTGGSDSCAPESAVNKQEIDLAMFVSSFKAYDEEIDSD
ncbi:hypothetical protein KR018_001512 [Drosophila ironensis]|nr:hypothetical protein KR018_001512 [Drosophila ironensis]